MKVSSSKRSFGDISVLSISVYPFNYSTLQKTLADKLYTPVLSSQLTCSDANDNSVNCPDGFCRSIFDGSGQISSSSCMKKGSAQVAYGMTVSRTTVKDIVDAEQSSVMYTCNTALCNSRENMKLIRQQLIDAGLISQETVSSTTTPTKQSTTTRSLATVTQFQSTLIYFSSLILFVIVF